MVKSRFKRTKSGSSHAVKLAYISGMKTSLESSSFVRTHISAAINDPADVPVIFQNCLRSRNLILKILV